ncbi:MAG: diaminopimelate epimerase [Deltaproteobacteria bacterium]|nr:diaminopimelate epimerase [Deltaproteobacteria bacterium]
MIDQIAYTKMHGCRNDYIYLDNLNGNLDGLSVDQLKKLSIKVSNRKTGLGSDGLIVIHKSDNPQAIARMQMFNADGSEGKMCGNGIRCVAKFLHEKMGAKPSFKISTLSGIRECFVIEATDPKKFQVRVNMGRPSFLPGNLPVLFDDVMVMDEDFEVDGKNFKISCVSMGNPHCVIEVDSLDTFDVQKYGSKIEKHEAFPEGVNVEFIEVKSDKILQRTWERGSGETQACGTGACAVGVVLIMKKKRKAPVDIQLKGGALRIEWDGLREAWMTGEAVTESTGTLKLKDWLN